MKYFVIAVSLVVTILGGKARGFEFEQHRLVRQIFRDVQQGLPASVQEQVLIAKVPSPGSSEWKFGWFVFGDPASRSVTVGLNGERLFADLDRNREFSAEEELPRSDDSASVYQAELGAEFFAELNDYEHYRRSVLLRVDPAGNLQVATDGAMVGRVRIGDKQVVAVRIDRNSNGAWFDAEDRIFLDTNHDGSLHPIAERIACDAICRIGGKRFAIESDQMGESLQLTELAGVGNVLPAISCRTGDDKVAKSIQGEIRDLSATLVSKSGIRVSLRETGEPAECPVGEYRVQDLSFTVSTGKRCFLYRFASLNSNTYPIGVAEGETAECELLGAVTLTVGESRQRDDAEIVLTVQPTLETSSGLFLQGCKTGLGEPTAENRLLVRLLHNGKLLDQSSTGFS